MTTDSAFLPMLNNVGYSPAGRFLQAKKYTWRLATQKLVQTQYRAV